MAGIHIKTENHYSKGRRTQIIHTQVDVVEMPSFGQFVKNDNGKIVPKVWDMPIIKKCVIHHNSQ